MTSDEVKQLYDELSNMPQDAAAQGLAPSAEQQQSQGVLAANMAQGISTDGAVYPDMSIPTADNVNTQPGISPYTYNRLISPTVNNLKTSLVLEGKQAVLNQRLKEMQEAAMDNYNNAKKSYYKRQAARMSRSYGGSGGSGGSGGGVAGSGGIADANSNINYNYTDPGISGNQAAFIPYGSKDMEGGTWDPNREVYKVNGKEYYWHNARIYKDAAGHWHGAWVPTDLHNAAEKSDKPEYKERWQG